MSAAHTEGPWEIDVRGGITARVNGNNRLVAQVVPTPAGDARADYDKRLIAAAPELLAVLKAYEEWASKTPAKDKELAALRDQMRAAIAKSTGSAS